MTLANLKKICVTCNSLSKKPKTFEFIRAYNENFLKYEGVKPKITKSELLLPEFRSLSDIHSKYVLEIRFSKDPGYRDIHGMSKIKDLTIIIPRRIDLQRLMQTDESISKEFRDSLLKGKYDEILLKNTAVDSLNIILAKSKEVKIDQKKKRPSTPLEKAVPKKQKKCSEAERYD